MEKISIAELKRKVNGGRVKFVAYGACDKVPFEKINDILNTPHDKPYSTISFNTVDMMRTMEDGDISYCSLKGLKAFMNNKGFVLVDQGETRLYVMVYQF